MARQVQNIKAVSIWDLFEGLEVLDGAFAAADHSVSWGDASYTLVSAETIRDEMLTEVDTDGDPELEREVEEFKARLAAYDNDVYFNLES